MRRAYDLLILGGGCAGLSLARHLCSMGYPGSVAIIEPRPVYVHDRTWCFWAAEKHALSALVSQIWRTWLISDQNTCVTHMGQRLVYQQIRSGDFYADTEERLEQAENISLLKGIGARHLQAESDHVLIDTCVGKFTASYVVDTRPRQADDEIAPVWQIFSGGEIETQKPQFDPDIAGLMQDMRSGPFGTEFTYILPSTPRKALIQKTCFSPEKFRPDGLDQRFLADLSQRLTGAFTVTRWERGCLPMGQAELSAPTSNRVIHAGQRAGALRPSSGYGFLRIQNWAATAALQLTGSGYLTHHAYGSAYEHKMDRLFLKALEQSPEASAQWFLRIAESLPGDAFGQFMSHTASPWIWFRLVMALPKTPFMRALFTDMLSFAQTGYMRPS